MGAIGPAPDDLAGLAAGPPPGAPQQINIPGGPPGGGGPMPGGPGAPPDAGGGLPPELAGLLGGGGPDEAGPPDAEGGGDSELDVLDQIRQLCLHYMDIASDDIEKSKMAQCLKIVQDLFAGNQKESEAASGVTPAHKGMARAIQSG